MKARRVVTTALVLGSLCFTAWRAPSIIESVKGAAAGQIVGGETAQLLAALQSVGAPGAAGRPVAPLAPTGSRAALPAAPGDFVLFSARGEAITDAQREALLRQAAANAPRAPQQPARAPKTDAPASPRTPGAAAPGADPLHDEELRRTAQRLAEELLRQKPPER